MTIRKSRFGHLASARWGAAAGRSPNCTDVASAAADGRVDPAALNNEAIREACFGGHTEVVRLLLADPRVDPTADHNKAMRSAVEWSHTEVEDLLVADGRAKLPLI